VSNHEMLALTHPGEQFPAVVPMIS
jgi:hypothetical protein